ncbi:hypothetical protein ACHAWU_000527 [Discostella pseudostelligera]|uniref:Uncharacterized protein n=1 Tax=Discostella pseudostelligera TaxID=259834 RepID=A0ABD3NA33_9STRA
MEGSTTSSTTTPLEASPPLSSAAPAAIAKDARGDNPTVITNSPKGNPNEHTNNNILRTKFLQPFLSGKLALSTVQSLARVAGTGGGGGGGGGAGGMGGLNNFNVEGSSSSRRRRSDDDSYYTNGEDGTNIDKFTIDDNESTNMDGFNKGAFGIANVLSQRRGGVSSNSRTQLIQWQRESLRNVRREIWDRASNASAPVSSSSSSSSMSSTAVASNESGGWGVEGPVTKNNGDDTNRMTPLVDILQQRATARTSSRRDTTNTSSSSNGKVNNGKGNYNNNNNNKQDQTTITAALKTIENDMAILDVLASLQPQLSGTEVGLLLGAIVVSGVGPIFFPGTSVTEVLAPAAAAFTASITIGSEYIGRVAVADGKEIAANTIQCAAEAEALLANAERVKAITPLCVGVGATCASFALLTPAIIDVLNIGNSVIMIAELYLLCPLVSVLAAAVANLALEETRGYASQAINVGVRRFSKRTAVGRTWLSSVEQIQKASVSKTDRWWSFASSVLPAPIIGSIVGGPSLSAKCIVVAALAAAQSAYFLAQAEGVLARATDAVALKARSAAVCDTYANQGARNSAILPFTSALSAFCAAATAATVELPFIDTISSLYGTMGEVVVVSTFPLLSSAFAAAAAVSKARCEVDAEAAAQAASTLALEYMDGSGDDPVLRPFREVRELVRLAVTSGWRSIRKGVLNPFENIWRVGRRAIMGLRLRLRSNRRGGDIA